MTIKDIAQIWSDNAGGAMVFIIVLSCLIQITPIKINPISWLGRMLNKDMARIEAKLDEHIAQSHRNKIFAFQTELLVGTKHTQEQFLEVLEACEYYEKYVEQNKIKNGKATEAIKYIQRCYRKCLDERSFVELRKE